MSEKAKINSITITPDGKTLCVALHDGFSVYNSSPLEEKFHQTETRRISFAVAQTNSPRVVYCGVEGQRGFNNKSICVFDTSIRRPVTQIDCPDPVCGIYALPSMFAVALRTEIRVYNFEPSGLYTQLRCAANEHAPCDFIENEGICLVAMCGRQSGTLRVVSVEASGSIDVSVTAHSHPISFIKFCDGGNLVATASEHGTLIRVFKSNTGDKIAEFRRGSFAAEIQGIAFSRAAKLIAITSSKNTLHVFKIEDESEETKRSTISWKIPDATEATIAFTEAGEIIAATKEGNMYTLKYNRELTEIESVDTKVIV